MAGQSILHIVCVCINRIGTDWTSGRTIGVTVASITIRKLSDDVKTRRRVRATCSACFLEEERGCSFAPPSGVSRIPRNLVTIVRSHFGPANGVDLDLQLREPAREPTVPQVSPRTMTVLPI